MLRALLTTLALTLVAPPAAAQLEVGELFPVISLPHAASGELGSVTDYRGKPLLLHLYASW